MDLNPSLRRGTEYCIYEKYISSPKNKQIKARPPGLFFMSFLTLLSTTAYAVVLSNVTKIKNRVRVFCSARQDYHRTKEHLQSDEIATLQHHPPTIAIPVPYG